MVEPKLKNQSESTDLLITEDLLKYFLDIRLWYHSVSALMQIAFRSSCSGMKKMKLLFPESSRNSPKNFYDVHCKKYAKMSKNTAQWKNIFSHILFSDSIFLITFQVVLIIQNSHKFFRTALEQQLFWSKLYIDFCM